jgi:hypothetical protein
MLPESLVAPGSDRVMPMRDAQGRWRFYPGCNRNTRVHAQVERIVLHWTGGVGGAERVARTLERAALSIHYVVEPDGRIVQLAAHGTRCAHAGRANDGSIGIEVVSRGLATRADDEYDVWRMDGRGVRVLRWPDEQRHATVWLAEALCGELGIPRRLPAEPSERVGALTVWTGDGAWQPCHERDVVRWSRFAGVIGHYHVHASKLDPGAPIMDALWREGLNPANAPIR